MKMVKKTSAAERVTHWLLMFSFLNLSLTGFAFAYRSLNWINLIYGGNHYAAICHRWNGVLFVVSLVVTLGYYLGEALKYGPEDSEWLKHLGGYFDKSVELPPQGKMNFGQKIFFLIVVAGGGALISISGFMLWFAPSGVGNILHLIAFSVMVALMPLHVYLATAANPGVFRVMTRGTVSLDYAKKHYGKWVKEMGLE